MSLLTRVINVYATAPQWWPDQKRRLDAIYSAATAEQIRAAYDEVQSRADCRPYNLCRETHVYGVGRPNMPTETDTQRAARVIRSWMRVRLRAERIARAERADRMELRIAGRQSIPISRMREDAITLAEPTPLQFGIRGTIWMSADGEEAAWEVTLAQAASDKTRVLILA